MSKIVDSWTKNEFVKALYQGIVFSILWRSHSGNNPQEERTKLERTIDIF